VGALDRLDAPTRHDRSVAPEPDDEPVVIRIRAGEIADAGSWLYVWVRAGGDRRVVYVGATGLPPAVRTWLHLHDPDPEIGRVAARYPAAAIEPLDVVAVRAPDGFARRELKELAVARLAAAGLLGEGYAGDAPAEPAGDPPGSSAVQRLVAEVARRAAP
jgi:hypothetical protein